MILDSWNSLRGYVVIEVSGFSVERFMNLATHKGVYIWDVSFASGAAQMKVSARAFRLLRGCARKTKCTVKIKSKHGFPFFAFRYRKRKILAWGMLFFAISVYTMSSFVWLVEVSGSERIAAADILRQAEGLGLRAGARKSAVDRDLVEQTLFARFPELTWADVSLKGTRATISIAEALPEQEIVDRTTPGHIIAKKDGLIVSMATGAGTPLKREHDVVRQGEILVSGEIIAGNAASGHETGEIREYVRARAEVWAKLYYDLTLVVPFAHTEKEYTGRTARGYRMNLMGRNINLINAGNRFTNYDKIRTHRQLNFGEDYPLPIIFITDECREFVPVERVRSIEQAMELGERMVSARIIREFDFETDIHDKELTFTQEENGIRVTALVTALERIDEAVEIGY
ncbi:MAG: sporulation protein YqfD [Defluviitaleaceae bacterium]|nr:sporulation protein YqfD [Defluviitaleaceae bacterium]